MAGERVLITGVTGQDGSFLAEYLLERGDTVAGFLKSSATGHLGNIAHLKGEIELFRGSLDDEISIENAFTSFKPDHVYNLGAEAAPADSFHRSVYTSDINALGPLRIFEAAKRLRDSSGKNVRVYQASTSEMFGAPPPEHIPQDENTPMIPNNPYGIAKLFAHLQARVAREGTDKLDTRCGMLFNHESHRRGEKYVTRKVSVGAACIKKRVKNPPLNEDEKPILNAEGKLEMGNLDAIRDWGYAKEYVQAMHLIMQQEKPDDFVIATGEMHSIEELLEVAFRHVGLDWQDHVVTVAQFKRPLETGPLCGNPAKAKAVLGWEPKVKFEELIKLMVDSDLARFS